VLAPEEPDLFERLDIEVAPALAPVTYPSAEPAVRAARAPVRKRRTLHVWRSPDDQPRWARPALLAVAALAALSYAWGIGHGPLQVYYAAAARSMSQSWHNFFFASFDPWGTVSMDKLPGAFWVQALSVRLFGVHHWSLVLPQAVEGTLTVLVIYRAVRRIGGAGAGLTAAVVLAATPVTIMLNRGNVADSLLILLLVLALDATTRAMLTGRLRSLLLAGAWVGLAFQAKMLQAWLVLPAIAIAYLVASPVSSLRRRASHVLLCAVLTLVVSVSWMAAVSLVPAHDRPYVDASCNDSVFSQVFLYNGADRISGQFLGQAGCSTASARVPGGTLTTASTVEPPSPTRSISGQPGRYGFWLLIPAAEAFVGILLARRRAPRTDPLRGAAVLWATWLLFTWSFFACSSIIHAYYLASLAPPIAALCGLGLSLVWRLRDRPEVRVMVLATVVTGALYELYLVPATAGVRPYVLASTVVLLVAASAAVVRSLVPNASNRTYPVGLALSALCLLTGSAWASAIIVTSEAGPFSTPFQAVTRTAADRAQAPADVAALDRTAAETPMNSSVTTVETSTAASAAVFDTGREFLPIGGYSGRVPSPALPQFIGDVRSGKVRDVLVTVSPLTNNADMLWVRAHCVAASPERPNGGVNARATGSRPASERLYTCTPADAR
jgi:4-amino-4-deoxy-L-arabinose transferase-like glycosyltransferase